MKLKNTSQKYKLETDENAENSMHWIVIHSIPLVELFFKETSLREPAVIETFGKNGKMLGNFWKIRIEL